VSRAGRDSTEYASVAEVVRAVGELIGRQPGWGRDVSLTDWPTFRVADRVDTLSATIKVAPRSCPAAVAGRGRNHRVAPTATSCELAAQEVLQSSLSSSSLDGDVGLYTGQPSPALDTGLIVGPIRHRGRMQARERHTDQVVEDVRMRAQ
jgi:hypothetical protein